MFISLIVAGIENESYGMQISDALLTGLANWVGSRLALRLSGLAILEEAHPLVWGHTFTEFTEFTEASSTADTAGMSRHRLAPYTVHYLKTLLKLAVSGS